MTHFRPHSSVGSMEVGNALQCSLTAKKHNRFAFCFEGNGLCTIGSVMDSSNPTSDWVNKNVYVGELRI